MNFWKCLSILSATARSRAIHQNRIKAASTFLVEVCDPSEATKFAYSCNGVLVSDFYTPRFFDPVRAADVRYSFSGAIKAPRQVLEGGYLSWMDPESGHWFQETFFSGSGPTFVDIGILDGSRGSLRAQIDRLTMKESVKALAAPRRTAIVAGLPTGRVAEASSQLAASWREQISELTANPKLNGKHDRPADGRRRSRSFWGSSWETDKDLHSAAEGNNGGGAVRQDLRNGVLKVCS